MAFIPFTTAVLAATGITGMVAIGFSILAYLRFRQTSYHRLLYPLVAATVIFTLAHGFLLLWPNTPTIVRVLEPLTYTVFAIGVIRLLQLHPQFSEIEGVEKK